MKSVAQMAEWMRCEAFWDARESVELHPGSWQIPLVKGVPENHLLFATSGSTGSPKWVVLGKDALAASAREVNAHLGVTAGSVWGLALPVHHVGGFGVVARAFVENCNLQVFDSVWDARVFCGWLGEVGVTHTSLVPTQVHDLVAAGCCAPAGLRAVVVGGGRLDVAAGRAARALGWPVLASYGLTEAASQVATQRLSSLEGDYEPAPLPVLDHWEVRVDAGGCLEIAGPALFSGWVMDGEYRPRTGKWYATRDRVAVRPEGLVPMGRADAVVKVAGELVDPQAVELRFSEALAPHGDAVAVVAVADVRLGSRLVLVAERRVPREALDAVVAGYNAGVPRSQRLGDPVWVERLPRSELGKFQRVRLAEMATAGGE